jgi:hypothetical protein
MENGRTLASVIGGIAAAGVMLLVARARLPGEMIAS